MRKNQTLKNLYKKEVVPKMMEQFGIKNPYAVAEIRKIVINMGTAGELRDKTRAQQLVSDMASITGQKPKVQQARVSVAGFGIRAGMPVGLTSTLRGERMWAFLEKLIRIVLPRLRDFRGVSPTSVDGNGNYSLGFKEYGVFPEINFSKGGKPQGLEVTIVTSGESQEQSLRMLELLGMPFGKVEQ